MHVLIVNGYRSDATGKFPEYPEEDEGGSGLIFKEKDPAELAAELQEKVKLECYKIFDQTNTLILERKKTDDNNVKYNKQIIFKNM